MAEMGGWSLNDLQNPAAVHLCVTLPVARRGPKEFLDDPPWPK